MMSTNNRDYKSRGAARRSVRSRYVILAKPCRLHEFPKQSLRLGLLAVYRQKTYLFENVYLLLMGAF